MAVSLGFACRLPLGDSDGLCCLFLFCFFISFALLLSPFAPTLSPSVAAPRGSFLASQMLQAGLGMEAEALLLPAFQEGKELAVCAAVTCWALGETVGMRDLT